MEPIGGAKKKKKAGKGQKSELIQIKVPVAKAGSKKYTHVDWEELLRENGKSKDEEELKRFYDEDTLFMAKKLAETKSKSGKKIRVNLDEIQHMNRNCGYDMDDDFIDDTEAVDSTNFTSKKGGFYAGKGDVKDVNDEDDDDEEEESEDETIHVQAEKEKKQRKKYKERAEKSDKSGEKSAEKSKENGVKSKENGQKSEKSTESSSSSEEDSDEPRGPQRMTGAPPTIRMAGAPPSKRLPMKRPTPPPSVVTAKSSEVPEKKKKMPVIPEITIATSSSSQSSDIQIIEENGIQEPPTKKKPPPPVIQKTSSAADSGAKPQPPVIQKTSTTDSGASSASGASASAPTSSGTTPAPSSPAPKPLLTSSTKGSTVTMLAKKICKQQEEINKTKPIASLTTPPKPTPSLHITSNSTPKALGKVLPSPSPSTSSSQSKDSNLTAVITNIYASLTKKGQEYKAKGLKIFDEDVLKEIMRLFDVMKHHQKKSEKISMAPLIASLSTSFGIPSTEVMKQVNQEMSRKKEKPPIPPSSSPSSNSLNSLDCWKLTQADLPFMSDNDIQMMTTCVKSWKSKKQLPNAVLTTWLRDVNREKLNADQARKKFFEYINKLPDLDTSAQVDSGIELPKHERSRKARMFLHQWVYLSRKYVELILPSLKKMHPTTEGYALKQVVAANALKDALKKQLASFENKKDRLSDDAVYSFQFTEPVLAAIAPYLDELVDYSLSVGKLDIVVTGIDSLHSALDGKISLIQFYIELCRRLQKLSFLTVEEPMKSRLKEANEMIVKHQVVQNPKYQIKWPDGNEPSLRGLNHELHDYEKSILWKAPRASSAVSTASLPSRPTTSLSTTTPNVLGAQQQPSTSSSKSLDATSSEDPKRLSAMNQLVQVQQVENKPNLKTIMRQFDLATMKQNQSPTVREQQNNQNQNQRMTGRPPF